MKKWMTICVWMLTAALTGSFAQEQVAAEIPAASETQSPARPGPALTLGGLHTESYFEGIGDVLIPVWFDGAGLLFINPRMSMTDRDEEEYNIGVGYRHLTMDRKALLGASLFYDRRDTRMGASFDQVGGGLEWLSSVFDARANVYVPLQDEKKVAEFTVEETVTSQRANAGVQEEWEEPQAAGNSLYQDYRRLWIEETQTTTLTTSRHYRQYEVAMRGWDAEIGARLPLGKLEEFARLKAFAGYVQYLGRRDVADIDCFRARLEMQIRPALTLDATYYSDDKLTGDNYSLSAFVSLPFDLSDVSRGRNPFTAANHRWQAGLRRENALWRMTEMVKRDPQIRSRVASAEEIVEMAKTSVATATRVQSRPIAEGTEEVATDITFVDGEKGNDDNPGTFEKPKKTVQGGVDEPRSMVFVHDINGEYTENVELAENVVLRGSGAPVTVRGGKRYGSGIFPLLNGGEGEGPTIVMAENTTVQGFAIVGPAVFGDITTAEPSGDFGRIGIFSEAGNVRIIGNRIYGMDCGVLINRSGDADILVADNEFIANFHGVAIHGRGESSHGTEIGGRQLAGGSFFADVRNNTFEYGWIGISADVADYNSALMNIKGNDVSIHWIGMDIKLAAADLALLRLSDTRANFNIIGGIIAEVIAHDGMATILGGTVSGSLAEAIRRETQGLAAPRHIETLLASGGAIEASDNGGLGMALFAAGANKGLMSLANASAHRNGYGYEFDFGSVSISERRSGRGDVEPMFVDGFGILAQVESELEATLLAENIAANDNAGYGLHVVARAPESVAVYIEGSIAERNGLDGIFVDAGLDTEGIWGPADSIRPTVREDASLTVIVAGNQANGNGGDGISVRAELEINDLLGPLDIEPSATVQVLIDNNQANGNGENGIHVVAVVEGDYWIDATEVGAREGYSADQVSVVASGNETSDNTDNGLHISATAHGIASVGLFDNTADSNSGDGAHVTLDGFGQVLFGVGNRFRYNNGNGLHLDTTESAELYDLNFGTYNDGNGSGGYNSIFGNGAFEINNAGAQELLAQNNYWAASPPYECGKFSSMVDFSHELNADPNP